MQVIWEEEKHLHSLFLTEKHFMLISLKIHNIQWGDRAITEFSNSSQLPNCGIYPVSPTELSNLQLLFFLFLIVGAKRLYCDVLLLYKLSSYAFFCCYLPDIN